MVECLRDVILLGETREVLWEKCHLVWALQGGEIFLEVMAERLGGRM